MALDEGADAELADADDARVEGSGPHIDWMEKSAIASEPWTSEFRFEIIRRVCCLTLCGY
jgi:hypothetical protein